MVSVRDTDSTEETTANKPPPGAPELEAAVGCWLVVLSGRSVGRIYRLQPGEVTIGRSVDCTVSLDEESVSRTHARLLVPAEGPPTLADLDSKNGTFVDDRRIGAEPVTLRAGQRIRVGPSAILKVGSSDDVEQHVFAELYHAATRDDLTRVFNRRFFVESLDQEVAWHRRHGLPLSVVFVDVDLFKSVNTRYGHPVGDRVLAEVANRLQRSCRTEDLLARYGGEEFVFLLRSTNRDRAARMAERVRERVASLPIVVRDDSIDVTVSVGVATAVGAAIHPSDLLALADANLRIAKSQGRNRVVA